MFAPDEVNADDDGDDDEGTEDTADDGAGGRAWSELPLLFCKERKDKATDSVSELFSDHVEVIIRRGATLKRSDAEEEHSDTS